MMKSPFNIIAPKKPQTTTVNAVVEKPALKTGNDLPKEIGGQQGPEPTRFGDWEKAGRCTDF